jgi:hypothetical protein
VRFPNAAFLAAALFAFTAAQARSGAGNEAEDVEVYRDLIHSDVPLWGTGPNVWPQSFTDEDGFGCTSRVSFGDWKLTERGGSVSWWRLGNYGVFHCATIERRATDRDDLKSARWSYGFFVQLGSVGSDNDRRELWALQSGTVPGSDYTLLARQADDKGAIKTFTVLQHRCPAASIRKGPSLDIWKTQYCSINSQSELIALARRMARLPPIGAVQFVEASPERN